MMLVQISHLNPTLNLVFCALTLLLLVSCAKKTGIRISTFLEAAFNI